MMIGTDAARPVLDADAAPAACEIDGGIGQASLRDAIVASSCAVAG